MRLLPGAGFDPVGLDIAPGPKTTHIGSITDASSALHAMQPRYKDMCISAGYRIFPGTDRIHDNSGTRQALGWQPEYDFNRILDQIPNGDRIGSTLSHQV